MSQRNSTLNSLVISSRLGEVTIVSTIKNAAERLVILISRVDNTIRIVFSLHLDPALSSRLIVIRGNFKNSWLLFSFTTTPDSAAMVENKGSI